MKKLKTYNQFLKEGKGIRKEYDSSLENMMDEYGSDSYGSVITKEVEELQTMLKDKNLLEPVDKVVSVMLYPEQDWHPIYAMIRLENGLQYVTTIINVADKSKLRLMSDEMYKILLEWLQNVIDEDKKKKSSMKSMPEIKDLLPEYLNIVSRFVEMFNIGRAKYEAKIYKTDSILITYNGRYNGVLIFSKTEYAYNIEVHAVTGGFYDTDYLYDESSKVIKDAVNYILKQQL